MYHIGIKIEDQSKLLNSKKGKIILPIFFLIMLSVMSYRTLKIVPPTEGSMIETTIYMIGQATEIVMKLRIMVTIFLILWLAIMTYYMAFKYDEVSIFDFWGNDELKKQEESEKTNNSTSENNSNPVVESNMQTINLRKTDKPTRLYYLHKIWFGDESIVYILFKIWFMTIMFFIALPIVKEVLVNLHLIESDTF